MKEGDQVKRDQLLMRLDPRAPQAAIEQSEAQVRQARLSIERRPGGLRHAGRQGEAFRGAPVRRAWWTPTASRSWFRRAISPKWTCAPAAKQLVAGTGATEPGAGTSRQDRDPLTARRQGDGYLRQGGPDRGAQLLRHLRARCWSTWPIPRASMPRSTSTKPTSRGCRVGAEARVVPAAFPDKTLLGTVDQVAIAPRHAGRAEQELPGAHPPGEYRGRDLPSRHELPRRSAHRSQRRRQGARGAGAGGALRGQSGQVGTGGKVGGQRVRL